MCTHTHTHIHVPHHTSMATHTYTHRLWRKGVGLTWVKKSMLVIHFDDGRGWKLSATVWRKGDTMSGQVAMAAVRRVWMSGLAKEPEKDKSSCKILGLLLLQYNGI